MIKSPTESVVHTSRTHNKKMIKLCDPLTRHLGIDTFWHYTISNEGQFSYISSDPGLAEFFWDQKLYIKHPYLRNANFYPSGYLTPHLSSDENYEATQGQMRKNELVDQIFMVFRRNENGLSSYCFSSKPNRKNMTSTYLNNLPLFNRFVDFFHDQAEGVIKDSLDRSIDLEAIAGKYFHIPPEIEDEIILPTVEKEFLLALEFDPIRAEVLRTLTPRERSCLYWFLRGRSASETAKLLFLSSRTVESYLENVKNRCGVSKRSELFDYLADWREHLSR